VSAIHVTIEATDPHEVSANEIISALAEMDYSVESIVIVDLNTGKIDSQIGFRKQ